MFDRTDQLAINALRVLSVDQINRANSGHPGLPLGAAPMAYALWRTMRQNPANPQWANRDRFVLSAGHGSALLYSLLHLSGYDLSIEDLEAFRQLGSRTPGHPEYRDTPGVEATTGPLGQGFANAVGMAMAEAHQAALYNTPSHKIVDHYTYALCGDGCLMEGISGEAASLAGQLKLGKLIVLYDSNDVCLDGPTSMTFSENVGLRFKAYGWQVLHVPDGNDVEAIAQALEAAKQATEQPTLIEVKTVIGFGSPKQGTNQVHGNPIGEEGRKALCEALDWKEAPFVIPQAVYDRFRECIAERGAQAEAAWNEAVAAYEKEDPQRVAAYRDALAGRLPENWASKLPVYKAGDKALATRKSSEAAIQQVAAALPQFWGGSADLSSSNNTLIQGELDFLPGSYEGRNIWYGVREFAMAAIQNGIVLHGGSKTYAATFFVFSDYPRAAVRVAALSKLPVIYVFTHDSVAVGEDGPTHEPIEQLASWRAMPNVDVLRPADGNEVSQAWRLAVESEDHPTLLVLSRQNLPVLEYSAALAEEGVARGGYVVSEADGSVPQEATGLLLATGSEVSLALEVQKLLADQGICTAVVSLPSFFRFDQQEEAYRERVLPRRIQNRMSIEMGATFGWAKYVGSAGIRCGIDRFGASGKGAEVTAKFGFTAKALAARYREAFEK
uniref:transketolase n=1 Tax=Ndongobacter massiliensis TaxID=1871025 RepID=UPI000931C304|nr:transketolase [Ndongobacter massiliensis]